MYVPEGPRKASLCRIVPVDPAIIKSIGGRDSLRMAVIVGCPDLPQMGKLLNLLAKATVEILSLEKADNFTSGEGIVEIGWII